MAKQRIPKKGALAPIADHARVDHSRTDQALADNALADGVLEFRAAVRDVRPLAPSPPPQRLAKPRARTRPRKSNSEIENLDQIMPLINTPPADETGPTSDAHAASPRALAGGDALSFQRAGVRTQVVRRLRRGLIPVESELDLHGLSQSSARVELAQFLESNRDSSRRCVRIIHGKGYRSGSRGPVLKIAVDLWLRRHPDVMAFTSARAIDGGTGAVYVLLRS